MRPVLFSVLGIDVQAYGVSKALAALVGAWLLGRAFRHLGRDPELAYSVVWWATLWGFAGAKVYYVLEHLDTLSWHHLGGMGFTWYGGLIGGAVAVVMIARRHGLDLRELAGAIAAPLSVAYGIGRLGCLWSGDGTYGRPTSLPWGMRLPSGVVPTDVPVHPTPLYEALAAFAIAGVLWWISRRGARGTAVFGVYLVLSGAARFGVEELRINEAVLLGLTQPQLWAVLGALFGAWLLAHAVRERRDLADGPGSGPVPVSVGGGGDQPCP